MEEPQIPVISDKEFADVLSGSRDYTLVILKTNQQTFDEKSLPIIREHGRRNVALRAAGILSIVCRVTDGGAIAGIGIFAGSQEQVSGLMDRDPAIEAGVLTYELYPARGFPGDSLPSENSVRPS
jgi:hypothetical protein